jgi:hypothetical protein
VLDHLAGDGQAADRRCADLRRALARDHQHGVEGDGVAPLAGELADRDDVVGGDAVLLAAGLDHCEHRFAPCSSRLSGGGATGRLLGSWVSGRRAQESC